MVEKFQKKHQSLLKSNRALKKLKATVVAKEAETEYEVDAILAQRMHEGVLEMCVVWTGYEETTWEPQKNLPATMVQHYLDCFSANPKRAIFAPCQKKHPWSRRYGPS